MTVLADHVVDQFEHAVLLAGDRDLDRARATLLSLDVDAIASIRAERLAASSAAVRGQSPMRTDGVKRKSVGERQLNAVFTRDSWTCRLCGARTLDSRVMRAMSLLFPEEFSYHPNWKYGVGHLLYWTHTASLEHVVPFARGGADDTSNFVTTCYADNDARGDLLLTEIGWELRDPCGSGWLGLTEHLGKLNAASTAE